MYGGRAGCGLGDRVISPYGIVDEDLDASPHRVFETWRSDGNAYFQYDQRGNHTLKDPPGVDQDRRLRYSHDDLAYYLERGLAGGPLQTVRFWYGTDGQRYKRQDAGSDGHRVTHVIGGVEVVFEGGTTTYKRDIGGFLQQTVINAQATDRYLFHDQLGSLVRITDADGNRVASMDFALSGERRNVADPRSTASEMSRLRIFLARHGVNPLRIS